MDTIFINSRNSNTSDRQNQVINLGEKNKSERKWKMCCIVKSEYLLQAEKQKICH